MTRRLTSALFVVAAFSMSPAIAAAQAASPAAKWPDRAIRHDLPMTNMITRAFASGTRDSTGRPGAKYWQLAVDYKIDARLDVATAIVTGRETVTIANPSDTAFRVLVLRLDQNVFSARAPRNFLAGEITEGMKITRLVVNGSPIDVASQSGAAKFAQTSASFRLPAPIAARGSGTVEVEWSFRVPNSAGGRLMRMGRYADSLYEVAQWYPRVAVRDDLRGWDTDPYLGSSEFYNNFGRFDVSLDLPAGWPVGATGVLQNPDQVLTPTVRERLSRVLGSDAQQTILSAGEHGAGVATAPGDRLIWHFVADSVSDFAWGTSDQYVWDATRAKIPGKGYIPIHIMYLPGDRVEYAHVGASVRHALEYYSGLWMPYAFPTMTVIGVPGDGMEYPSLIMSGREAADHEVGHQWWPMMVGVNETWYGWMDEGFNQYMNIFSDADFAGRIGSVDKIGQSYGASSGSETEGTLMWDANYGGPGYGFQAYGKAPMMLSMLGGIVGDSAVQRAMSEYAKVWRFKHPSPWDYAFFMNNTLHQDLGWFWYYWLFTTESVEGSLQGATTLGSRTVVTIRQEGQMPSPVVLAVTFAPTGPALRLMPNSRMIDSVTALVTYPVDVWWNGSKSFKAELRFGGRKIVKVVLDPFGRFPDRNPRDNYWPADSAPPLPAAGGRGGGQ